VKPKLFKGPEKEFLLGVSVTLALMQLGLLLVMPFLAVFGEGLEGNTPGLVGFSIGVFGLTQAFLQIPYGNWSDRYGRKRMILIGLSINAIGLITGFLAHNIWMLVIARAIQGAGAIGTVLFAWIGDRIEPERRSRAMAYPGIFVGIASILSFIVGPILHRFMTVNAVFLAIFILVIGVIIYIQITLPAHIPTKRSGIKRKDVLSVFKKRKVWGYLMAGVMMNYVLTSFFFLIPVHLDILHKTNLNWLIFVPTTITALAFLRMSSIMADKGKLTTVLVSGFSLQLASMVVLLLFNITLITLIISAFFFMAGFMSLNTTLPAAVTLLTGSEIRGTVTGVYSTFQNIGSFVGSTLTGILFGIGHNIPVIVEGGLLILVIAVLTTTKRK
ncbi:MAG: MFS transporter, partial [Bacteroidia bacterium]|nr:MFS transporter [Bacteroidia bacterium]